MSPRSLFAQRSFRLLLVGQTTAQLGTQVSAIAIPLLAVVTLHATALEVGLLNAAGTIAFALIGLPAGAWLDRWRRGRVLIISDVVRAVALAIIPLAAWIGHLDITILIVISFIVGCARVFFDVGSQSYLPSVIGRDQVLAGNSSIEVVRATGQVVGPGLGGLLVTLVGAANVVFLQAATFAVSALTIAGIRSPTVPVARQREPSLRAEIGEGVRFVAGNRVLRATALASACSNLSFAVASAVTIIFLTRDLGVSAVGIGCIIAAASVAALVGAAVTPRLARVLGSARLVWWSLAITAPITLLVVFAQPGWWVLLIIVSMAAGEFGQIVYAVANVSLRQRLCPDRLLGRVNATMRFVIMGLFPLGAIIGGVLGEAIGARSTLLVAGVLALVAPVFPFRALRGFRRVEQLPRWEGRVA